MSGAGRRPTWRRTLEASTWLAGLECVIAGGRPAWRRTLAASTWLAGLECVIAGGAASLAAHPGSIDGPPRFRGPSSSTSWTSY